MDSPRSEREGSTPEELPAYARVEDIERYTVGGFHPIHLGDRIGPEDRFEVHHKLGHSNACTAWLCFDHKNEYHVCVKIFQADQSSESHPEIGALRLFEGVDPEELRFNHIFTIDEYFWIDGPNGRHLCFVVEVLGPAISYSLRGMDLDTPDLLTNLCFQAAQSLKYLHDKGICHGDFRPEHIRMQIDTDAMGSADVYELFGEPKLWYLDDTDSEMNYRKPRYQVEPADIASVEAKYRTGRIAIDSFFASHREGVVTEPQILDTQYAAPEIRFLKKSCGTSSDIWSLASTIYLVRTAKLLLAQLDSRSSLVSWLAWAYGPFPQDYWKAVGEYLSSDSAIPIFTTNTLFQKPLALTKRDLTRPERENIEWGESRRKVVAALLGGEETPRSVQQRKKLQDENDHSNYLRIKLPKNSKVWARFQEQRKQLTGFRSLLHEDLSKERQWYQDTDALNDQAEHMSERRPSATEDVVFQRLNGNWEPDAEVSKGYIAQMDMMIEYADDSVNKNGKRVLIEDQGVQPNPKKVKMFVAEHNLRDQVECVEQDNGMTKLSYRLQLDEVDLLASLLRDMLRNDPSERISIDEVLQHEWFDASRKRLG
ncbi:kinase-like domain-containing protein [Nemania sp. FL0031]|nr:kinase-like domain-containing protein [Nemania sp. FL0031]